MVRILTVLLIAATAFRPAAAKESAPLPPAPALWKVSDADSEIYLFAAAPFLPAGEAWRSRAVAAAIDHAQSIVFEAPAADPAAQAAATRLFDRVGRTSGGMTLSGSLGEEEAAGLAAVAAALDAETAQFDALKPWAAFVVLSAELDRKRGADPAAGVEMGVLKEAIGRQRPVRFLDTVEGALRVLTDMPEADQRALLSFLLADWPRQDETSAAAFAAWRAGDAEAVAVKAQEPLRMAAPGAYDRLIAARADFLADRIAVLLQSPEAAFVCLGASLVVGADGVAAGLEERGFDVERIDARP